MSPSNVRVSPRPYGNRRGSPIGGTVVILGVMPQGEKIEIEPFDILLPDLRVLGSFLNPFVHRRAAALVASGAAEIDKLISRRVSLDEAAAVIAHRPADGEVKILVMPGGI